MIVSSGNNYNKGKKQESESFTYLQNVGYVNVPPGTEGKYRKNIQEAFANNNRKINQTGFDCVETWVSNIWHDVDALTKAIKENKIILYEVKPSSTTRQKPIKENWQGLGFTYTIGENNNWEALGDEFYKFIFVDCMRKRHIVLHRDDWFETRSSPSITYSVNIRQGGPEFVNRETMKENKK